MASLSFNCVRLAVMHSLREEDTCISDAEQLPVSSLTHQQSFIKQFTSADVYKSDLIAYLTHFYTDLTHFHLCSHSY